MRTVILSVFLAAVSTASAQQDPPKTPSKTQPAPPKTPASQSLPSQSPQSQEPPLSVLCAPGTTIQLGVAYNSPVIASGGTGAYQFAITGGALPNGIALNPATGVISGIPTADGTFSYTVQVTDSAGSIATTGSTPCTMQPPLASPPATGTPAMPALPAASTGSTPPAETLPSTKPVIAQPEIDPAKLAEPRDKAIATAAATVPLDDRPYVLGAKDNISVQIYGSPEFSGTHMIRPDGKITMPFLGDVMAAGYAPQELGNIIRDKLKKYIVDPDVTVGVLAVNSKEFYIQGEVGRTGAFPLLVPTRVLEALVNAGGFRDFANQKKIIIMRLTGERLKFNYKEVIQGKKMDQNIFLKPGDIIIVK